MTWFLGFLAVALVVVLATVAALKIESHRTPVPELGVDEGHLAPCPSTPNCVSSQADPHDDAHYLAPIAFEGDEERVVQLIDEIVMERPRTTRLERDGPYLRYTFETYLMRFTDDVEFWVDSAADLIHFRSASRFGGGDMGTNRTRMRSLKQDIEEALERENLEASEGATERR